MKKSQQPSLKGTLISVFFVGFIIVLMWVSIYFLYVSRL
ncbi:cytochrome C oxidase subunit II [Halobacillus salinus]|uniref:Cytochrome C oxidase subunit II n=1 Tax=Halobacillus salinus TaxID=192814 RepID=A0A4Z0GYB3_9BACI|nr:cytochrome C oxidase subunit II [Halobacillus salinus]TGB02848.1 cytochrome C oxidase subunit II [Halobacillus salinus]